MKRSTYEEMSEQVFSSILATPGISVVDVAKIVYRSPESVIGHMRKLAKDGRIARVRIGNSSMWFEAAAAVEFEEKHKSVMLAKLRILSDASRARKHRADRARLEAISDKEVDEFLEGSPIYRIVCAKTAPRIKTTAANSVWQFADRA